MNSVAVIDRALVLRQAAQSLGLPFKLEEVPTLSRALIAQSLRRAVFIAAPCLGPTLRSLVFAVLEPISNDAERLKVQIDDGLQDLIAIGDVLEMRTDAGERGNTMLRPAPPAFIVRKDGSLIVIGVAGDEITPVREPPIVHQQSGLRTLRPVDAGMCRAELLDLGLVELPERLWLYAPAATSAHELAAEWMERLPSEPRPETIDGLELLGNEPQTSFYKGRWTNLHQKHVGVFVARRPQRFGAKLWCLVDVRDGTVQRFTDIRAKDTRTRDCDEAWRLQAALDASSGAPQRVRVQACGPASLLSFSAPLPAWASRRLAFIGEQVDVPRALISFKVPMENVQDELRWLGENLWLVRSDDGGIS